MAGRGLVLQIAPGTFRAEVSGRIETVYVAGPSDDRWAFWNGQVYRSTAAELSGAPRSAPRATAGLRLSAPVPATVGRVFVKAGSAVKKGDTLLVLEAMKMEWPIRAASDGTVEAVHCREGELVGADQPLVTMA